MALLKLLRMYGKNIESCPLCGRQQVAIRLEEVQQGPVIRDDRIHHMPIPLIGASVIEYVIERAV
ncbi:hypothetical protein ACN6LA_007623 [Streptomyces sp. SAS_269]|uniref:hypothetical protein n=1 Tax=Streptomyces sp. SAS_269 TaxID=3412749 RepID=UPI00403C85B6